MCVNVLVSHVRHSFREGLRLRLGRESSTIPAACQSAAKEEAALPGESVSIRQALLWERRGDALRCLTCERQCMLDPGHMGWCRTRENRDGTLVTLIYGLVSSLSCNPI
jgi:hypothetical protein